MRSRSFDLYCLINSDLSAINNCDNTITNLLLIEGGFPKNTTPKAIRTNDARTLINSPVTSGYFYAIREMLVMDASHIIVRLTEIYPQSGRIWLNTYNHASWDAQGTWDGWKKITPTT